LLRRSNAEQIQALIGIRDQLTGEAAALVQLTIDKLMEPLESAWSARKPTAEEMQYSIDTTNLLAR
jgi:hypothetical protein